MMKQDDQFQKGDRFSVGIKVTLDDQVRVLRNRIAENPNDSEAYKKLGFILSDEKYEKKDFQEASEHLNKAIELGLDDLEIRLRLGAVLLKIREYDKAEKSYRKAIEFDSKCGDAHIGLGISLRHLKRYPEAKVSLQKALELQRGVKTPEMTEALADIHINLAKVAFESKEYKECERECESALELKPDFVQGYIWLGRIRYAKEDYHSAKEKFEKAISLNPNDAEPHYYLGLIFEKLKRIDEAEEEYKKAIKLNPNFADAHCKLGLSFKSQKRFVEAVSLLKKALELQSDLIEAKECLKELTSQPPEKVREAEEKAKRIINEAESLIKEMDNWHCQSLPLYNEAINKFNSAKDLMKIAHYYGYIEATASAEKAIEIAKKCIREQKNYIGLQFYEAKQKVAKLLENAKEYKAKKYYPEDYKRLEEEFLRVSGSFTQETFERITSLLQDMNRLVTNAGEIVSKSYSIFDAHKKMREESLKQAKQWILGVFSFLILWGSVGVGILLGILGGTLKDPSGVLVLIGFIICLIFTYYIFKVVLKKLYPDDDFEYLGASLRVGVFYSFIGSLIGSVLGAIGGCIVSGFKNPGVIVGSIVGQIIGGFIGALRGSKWD